jgi:UDP-2-acetamido-3-amino-2,3-dideoxy-glucuronate N-acetyltransferase
MQQRKSVALVGCGKWGRNIARNLSHLGVLKIVCDADDVNVAPLASELGAAFTKDFRNVLSSSEVNAVVIATPATTHAALATEAISAGKHVYLEKPLAISTGDGKALAALAADRGRVLMVGHLLQYHPGFMKLLELVRDGKLGKISYVYSNRLNVGVVRTEENVLWSLAPHDFSMVLAVLGEAPNAVTAHGAAILQPRIEDLVSVHMTFPSGARAHIFCSWLNPFKEHKLTVIGDKAMAVFDDTSRDWKHKSLALFEHKVVTKNAVPLLMKGEETTVAFEEREPLRDELMHFLECVETGGVPRTGAQEAIPVLEALERAQKSMEADDDRQT